MSKPSYRQALAIAKQVKLQLASGADGSVVRMTAQDKAKAYSVASAKQGKTVVELANELQFKRNLLKEIGL
jgi:hypothetical protein